MKKLIITLIIGTTSIISQAQNVAGILEKIQENERINSSQSSVRQTITTSSGSKRTLEMQSYSKDFNASQLSIYTAPARVKGDKILMINDGDDIWFFTPKTDRIRHLASHAKKQKVQGSDFSYEDYENWDYKKDFTSSLIGKEKVGAYSCYKLKLVPTESGPHYSSMIIWADMNSYVIRKAQYFEEGELLKTLECKDVVEIGGHWIPKKLIMINNQDGGETTIESYDMKIDVNLSDAMFTSNNLMKR